MPETPEKLVGTRLLPIFPLPLVLLPYELLPLHIFEPRYRRMLTDITAADRLFGVNHIDPEESERPEPGSIGCAAAVHDIQPMPDGRSNIVTTGLTRYQLVGFVETDSPYLIAEVEFFEDVAHSEFGIAELANQAVALFDRVARAAHEISGGHGKLPDLPRSEPEALSFLISAAFSLEPAEKLRMLEMRSTRERLERLREILVAAVEKIEPSAEIHRISKSNGHSKKKVDY
ncbi:MAG TPA: LON peptidase substrate-binding domain-containing protein [Pyrinomonadaceae bacterium]|nr:LON peptidase substrate-binding domain-containing protein [Pyrinomonadaceae bacterium]